MSKQLAGTPFVTGGTATTTYTSVVFNNPLSKAASFAREIIVRNTGATNALQVLFPGNSTVATVPANSSERYGGAIQRVSVKSAASTTTYEIFASVA